MTMMTQMDRLSRRVNSLENKSRENRWKCSRLEWENLELKTRCQVLEEGVMEHHRHYPLPRRITIDLTQGGDGDGYTCLPVTDLHL